MKTLTQKKDGSLIISFFDKKTGEPISIVGWTLIKMRLIFSSGVILEKFAPLTAAVNEVQKITADDVPDAGNFTIGFDGVGSIDTQTTAPIAFDANLGAIEAAINALVGISGVVVTGAWPAYTVTFAGGSAGRNWPIMVLTSSLTKVAADISLIPTEEIRGIARNGVDIIFEHPAKIKIYLSEDDLADLGNGHLDIDPHIRIGEDDLSIPIHKNIAKTEAIPE